MTPHKLRDLLAHQRSCKVPTEVWVVRAGRGAEYIDEFIERGIVAIGWNAAGAIAPGVDRDEVYRMVRETHADANPRASRVHANIIYRFLNEVAVGDPILTYHPGTRIYYLGKVASEPQYQPDCFFHRVRQVEWTHRLLRDQLSVSTRNSLGAISTMYRLGDQASEEVLGKALPLGEALPDTGSAPGSGDTASTPSASNTTESDDDPETLRGDVVSRSEQFIEDRIAQLDWEDLQLLVAGILRAMGYRTKVAARGPDRGVDVFASPDGLGLEEPRIFVEVKHRPNSSMGAPDVRAFLGGRQAGDRGLYVSTGGFSREARYEAERASIPVQLIAVPELRELLVEYYGNLDAETTALVPLKRIYWPAD